MAQNAPAGVTCVDTSRFLWYAYTLHMTPFFVIAFPKVLYLLVFLYIRYVLYSCYVSTIPFKDFLPFTQILSSRSKISLSRSKFWKIISENIYSLSNSFETLQKYLFPFIFLAKYFLFFFFSKKYFSLLIFLQNFFLYRLKKIDLKFFPISGTFKTPLRIFLLNSSQK